MGKKKQEEGLEQKIESGLFKKSGLQHLRSGGGSLLGGLAHAIGSLFHGTAEGLKGAGHWTGKGIGHVGHATGKVAYGGGKLTNYLANRLARVDPQEEGYIVIKPKEYRTLIEDEPEAAKILKPHLYKHGNEIRLPLDEMSDIMSELEGHHPRRGRYHKVAAAFLLIASAMLADFTVTGAAIGIGGFATYAPVFSLLFLLTAIALFYKK